MQENLIEALKKDLTNVIALVNAKEKEIKAWSVKVNKLEEQFIVISCNHCNLIQQNSFHGF